MRRAFRERHFTSRDHFSNSYSGNRLARRRHQLPFRIAERIKPFRMTVRALNDDDSFIHCNREVQEPGIAADDKGA